jgi:RNA polymerase sigma factor (sigma-70 family)
VYNGFQQTVVGFGVTPDSTGIVFILDDDASLRRSLIRLLRSAGYEVRDFADAPAFLDQADYPPAACCLVLDLNLPVFNGLELQRRMADAGLVMPVIFLTGHGDVTSSVRAMKAGAAEFLEKPCPDAVLLAAVEEALRRDRRAKSAHRLREDVNRRLSSLTPREREVLDLLVTGLLNKQAAGRLGITEKTVKVHRSRIMAKMNAASLAALVHRLDEAGTFPRSFD